MGYDWKYIGTYDTKPIYENIKTKELAQEKDSSHLVDLDKNLEDMIRKTKSF